MTDQSTPTISDADRKERNLSDWRKYLEIRKMLADDRTQPYIAKKLGYNNASSIANILNRFQGLEELLADFAERITPGELDKWYGQGTMQLETKVWNDCIDLITQNIKAELGAAPINSKEDV